MWPTKSFHYMRWKIFAAKVKWRWARKSSLKGKNTLYPKLKLQNQGGPLRGISFLCHSRRQPKTQLNREFSTFKNNIFCTFCFLEINVSCRPKLTKAHISISVTIPKDIVDRNTK